MSAIAEPSVYLGAAMRVEGLWILVEHQPPAEFPQAVKRHRRPRVIHPEIWKPSRRPSQKLQLGTKQRLTLHPDHRLLFGRC